MAASTANAIILKGLLCPEFNASVLISSMHSRAGIVVLTTCLWCVCCWRSHAARRLSVADKGARPSRSQALSFVLHSMSGRSGASGAVSSPRDSSGPESLGVAPGTGPPPHSSPPRIKPSNANPSSLFRSVDGVIPWLYDRASSTPPPEHHAPSRLLQRPNRPGTEAGEDGGVPLRRSYSAGAELSGEPPARQFSAFEQGADAHDARGRSFRDPPSMPHIPPLLSTPKVLRTERSEDVLGGGPQTPGRSQVTRFASSEACLGLWTGSPSA